MFGYPKYVLGTSGSFTSECLWQRFASVGTQRLAAFGQPWLLGNDLKPAIGCSPDVFTPMMALGVGHQPLRAMATRAPTLHETTQHSIGLMLIWSFIAVTVVVTAFPFIAVFH